MTRNRLAEETSPYLKQHEDNPVHWYAWGDEALAAAREQDKPILLSIGYAACHWCHVMAHESFENDGAAALMNEHFINIKVDREERPDIDNIYQNALAVLGENGGWPLTMFLTPDLEPFWGGTYFPPESRYGRPGFRQVLLSLSETYRSERGKIASNADRVRDALKKLATPEAGGGLSREILDETSAMAIRYVDPIHGGVHGAPKFPQVSFFQGLWRAYLRTGGALFREAVTGTLSAICQGGIYDHLGGGFARYSTDAHWLAPHFEKMLYDNALLLELMAEVWPNDARAGGNPVYPARASETVDWLIREMRSSDGGAFGFISAYDADSEGVEGRFYVWSDTEIGEILGDAAPEFKKAYGVTPGGNWEGANILNRSRDAAAFQDHALEKRLEDGRRKLFGVRAGRVWPGRDGKVLADWNGMTIAALAKAAGAFDRPGWLDPAKTAFQFVLDNLSPEPGRLLHCWCDGRAAHPATLDDYANMSRAALMLFEATGDASYPAHAEAWMETVERRYRDPERGGYFLAADDTPGLIIRNKVHHDNAAPAGNGTAVEVLARLYHLSGKPDYADRARRAIDGLAGTGAQDRVHQGALLAGYEILEFGVQVVIVGTGGDADSLAAAARRTGHPNLVLNRVGGAEPPGGHPAHGKGPVEGKAAAYVCVGTACSPPITDPDALGAAIRKRV